MTFAVIPAAGKSLRMGQPKLALPLGERTILEWVIASLRDAGVEYILVVVGPHVPQLVPLAMNAGAHVLPLPAETPDMRATVEAGLRWLEERFRPGPEDGWLLAPADHPTLDPLIIRMLLWARGEGATTPSSSRLMTDGAAIRRSSTGGTSPGCGPCRRGRGSTSTCAGRRRKRARCQSNRRMCFATSTRRRIMNACAGPSPNPFPAKGHSSCSSTEH